jgi:hypothetical protein
MKYGNGVTQKKNKVTEIRTFKRLIALYFLYNGGGGSLTKGSAETR